MSTDDLEHRLADLADLHARVSDPSTEDVTVLGDLDRARRALRARRTRRARVVSLGAVATLGATAAVAIGVDAHNGPSTHPSVSPPPGHTRSTPQSSSVVPRPRSTPPTRPPIRHPKNVRLVSYRGAQQAGFHVSFVPQGFVLQGADDVELAVARPGDHTGIFDFTHKITISVQLVSTHGPLDPDADHIEVQGHDGTISTTSDGTTMIYYQLDSKRLAFIQAWRDVGLSRPELERFAQGVTIADDVETVS